jgi:hypothetical protein
MKRPIRIQRKRSAGWKMPPNTISVCRPGKWGNPFTAENSGRIPSRSAVRLRGCTTSRPCAAARQKSRMLVQDRHRVSRRRVA